MKNILFSIIILFSGYVISQNSNPFFKQADMFFSTYVTNGLVNYEALKEKPEDLESLIKMIEVIEVDDLDLNSQKAFWINAYNLIVIRSVVNAYPITSPLNVPGFFDKAKHVVSQENITLNDIENIKLRAVYEDPRIHFVLVCAGLGCPPLINKAYIPDMLEEQLEIQTRKAINDPNFIQLNHKRKKVAVSEIFKWYLNDFASKESELLTFINTFRDNVIPTNYKLGYYIYDWNLNKI